MSGVRVKVITVRQDAATGAFDDAELVDFTAANEVVSVQNHLVTTPHAVSLAFVVLHRGPLGSPTVRPPGVGGDKTKDRTDWRATVPEGDRSFFDVLRTWRNERADRLGKPAWVLFTNEQLAEIVKRRPATLTALAEVPGLGDARVKDFGEELVALVGTAAAGTPAPAAEPQVSAP